MSKVAARFTGILLALAVMLAFLPALSTTTYAKDDVTITVDGFTIEIYYDGGETAHSVIITKYSGTEKDLTLPTAVVYDGQTIPIHMVGEGAFKGNSNLTSVIVPNGYEMIGSEAFAGCPNLTEVTLGDFSSEGFYIGQAVFNDCPKLKTLRIGNKTPDSGYICEDTIGKNSDGTYVSGITVHLVKDSAYHLMLEVDNEKRPEGSKLTLVTETNPAAKANVTRIIPDGAGDPTKQMGEDGTAIGKGASKQAAEKAITAWSSEADPKGSVFNGLQAKITKVKTNSLKLSWKKVSGATTFVIFGNLCGKTKKMQKLQTAAGSSVTFKKVLGKKVKKGTYYKFIVVALDKSGKVVSTSKIVHAATKGGKVGNDKSIKTAAKKNKVSIKKGKTFKLKAKAVPESKKLKVNRHRTIKYETTNKKVASVSSKGVIKGTGKGTCYVYAYAQNGVAAKIKVTVK